MTEKNHSHSQSSALQGTFAAELQALKTGLETLNEESPWLRYGLLSNPFPQSREVIHEVCVDQEHVKQGFRNKLIACYKNHTGDTLYIVGDTGAGKTNMLRYYEALVNSLRESGHAKGLFPLYVAQPGDTFLEVHRQIVAQLAQQFFVAFFDRVRADREAFKQVASNLGVSPALLSAINYVTAATLDFGFGFLDRVGTFERWLGGGKQLSASERKALGLSFDLDSSSVALKVLTDLTKLLEHYDLCRQFVILFDEFEEVASDRLSSAAKSRYAQDVRHFLDTFAQHSLFVLVSIPLANKLHTTLPALVRRLQEPHPLNPIIDHEQALLYADAYLRHGREQFVKSQKPHVELEDEYAPLSKARIQEVFDNLQEEVTPHAVLPGFYLHELYKAAEDLVMVGSQS